MSLVAASVPSRAGALLAPAVAASLYVFSLCYNLHYFYCHGANTHDAGVFAWVGRYAAAWPLPDPALIGDDFFAGHLSPIFFLTGALGRLLPGLPYPVWFGLWFSAWPALLWIGIYALLGAAAWPPAARLTLAARLLQESAPMASFMGDFVALRGK